MPIATVRTPGAVDLGPVTAAPLSDDECARYPLRRALGLSACSGLIGLAMLGAVAPAARWTRVSPTVIEMCVLPFALNAVNLAVMAWALRRYEGTRLRVRALGLWPIR